MILFLQEPWLGEGAETLRSCWVLDEAMASELAVLPRGNAAGSHSGGGLEPKGLAFNAHSRETDRSKRFGLHLCPVSQSASHSESFLMTSNCTKLHLDLSRYTPGNPDTVLGWRPSLQVGGHCH